MNQAIKWLSDAFGLGGGAQSTAFKPTSSLTEGKEASVDDAVLAAAMHAALATPRGSNRAVDDKPMAQALHKMFQNQQH